jgi:Xaa-Pro aminopeptidase
VIEKTLDELEATGENFSVDKLLDVRARTRRAIHVIARQIKSGMSEDDAKDIAKSTLTEMGMRRGWHHIIVRCGPNTTKDFMERSETGVVLGDNDIFFVDIGPIYEETVGDGGDTFVLGENPDHARAKRDVREIWERTREYWFDSGVTGQALYEFAVKTTEDLGWKLNLDLSGHRLSDFPHSAHYDGSIADVPFELHPDRWVLEIAIIHPDKTFGAFYEDLLLKDQSFPESVFAV